MGHSLARQEQSQQDPKAEERRPRGAAWRGGGGGEGEGEGEGEGGGGGDIK